MSIRAAALTSQGAWEKNKGKRRHWLEMAQRRVPATA